MEIGVLGPLFLRAGSVTTAPGAPKLRSVLATLGVHAGQVVPVSVLIRELWDENPPASALTTLQTYILNLRKLMMSMSGLPAAEVSRDILVTRAGGYVLNLGDNLDLRRYQDLVRQGRELLNAGDDAAGMRLLDDALRLWRGPALVDVQGGRVLDAKRRQFEESRLVVLEHLIDARLRQGMYHEALTELAGLTAENPLHEGLHAQYMWALHCSGRRAQALEVFTALRDNLVAELGLEPGLLARRVQQAILNSGDEISDPFSDARGISRPVSPESGRDLLRTY